MTKSLRAIAKGKVQGVGFRYTVQDLAKHLHLVGFVKNLSDGSVEMVIQGNAEKIEELLEQLKHRFLLTDLILSELTEQDRYSTFEIRR